MEVTKKVLYFGAVVLLAGCAVNPRPMSSCERAKRIEHDKHAMFDCQERVSSPLTLADATARALKYNLDLRVKAADAVLASGDLKVANMDMLPDLVASAGYISRSNEYGVRPDPKSPITSFSQDRHRRVLDLQMTWNILDFGVSWINSKQKSDHYLIALERRRKMQQNVVRDVRYAYYRALSAQKLLREINPLVSQVRSAEGKSRRLEREQAQSPIEALRYQKSLVSTLRDLTTLQRELTNAKKELAALMSLPPNVTFRVDESQLDTKNLPRNFTMNKRELEYLALQYRPELREEDYRNRISLDEVTKAKMRLLPGVELNAGENFDSNSFLVNNNWANYGAQLTWNLLKLISGPTEISRANSEVTMTHLRRMALSMAVLTQVDVSYIRLHSTKRDLQVAKSERDVTNRLYHQILSGFRAEKNSELEVIKAKTDNVLAQLRYDLTYAEWQNASGQLLSATGYDLLPVLNTRHSVAQLSREVRRALNSEPTWVRAIDQRKRGHQHHASNQSLPQPSIAYTDSETAKRIERLAGDGNTSKTPSKMAKTHIDSTASIAEHLSLLAKATDRISGISSTSNTVGQNTSGTANSQNGYFVAQDAKIGSPVNRHTQIASYDQAENDEEIMVY